MGYVKVTSTSGIMKVAVDSGFWLYLAITLPLMIITILISHIRRFLVERKALKERKDLEKGKCKVT